MGIFSFKGMLQFEINLRFIRKSFQRCFDVFFGRLQSLVGGVFRLVVMWLISFVFRSFFRGFKSVRLVLRLMGRSFLVFVSRDDSLVYCISGLLLVMWKQFIRKEFEDKLLRRVFLLRGKYFLFFVISQLWQKGYFRLQLQSQRVKVIFLCILIMLMFFQLFVSMELFLKIRRSSVFCFRIFFFCRGFSF